MRTASVHTRKTPLLKKIVCKTCSKVFDNKHISGTPRTATCSKDCARIRANKMRRDWRRKKNATT